MGYEYQADRLLYVIHGFDSPEQVKAVAQALTEAHAAGVRATWQAATDELVDSLLAGRFIPEIVDAMRQKAKAPPGEGTGVEARHRQGYLDRPVQPGEFPGVEG